MMQLNKLLLVALAAASLCSAAQAGAPSKKEVAAEKSQTLVLPEPGVVPVSDYEFNTFIFAEPAKQVLFPANSPVTGEPITLANNTQVLLQFTKGTDRPVQMVVELASGKVEKIRVLPKPIPGVTVPVDGAKPTVSPRPAVAGAAASAKGGLADTAPRGEDIELLKKLTSSGQPPSGFDPVTLPGVTKFDKFSVVPLAGWTDGTRKVFIFSLVAAQDQTAVVSPNQFYRDGITAVMLDGDVVDATNSPQLFVVEENRDE